MSTAISSLLSFFDSAHQTSTATPESPAVGPATGATDRRSSGDLLSHSGSVSAATERLHAQVRTVGPHFRTALITGERGARKEEVARALHCASPVAKGPFVVCDSGLMEKLLRGGCSTQATGSEGRAIHKSLARTAHGGTIFFPELSLFSLTGQKELLAFLDALKTEEGTRIRVIASVSGEVQALVAGGMLLPELRERVGVIEIAVAPLRERLADFAAVASRTLEQIAKRTGGEKVSISVDALQELQRRGWPGNDRELESALRMAALTSGRGLIEAKHLPPATERVEMAPEKAAGLMSSSMRLQDVLDAHVHEVLRRCDGNKLKAAEVLGISRSTLYRMLDAAAVAL